MRDLSSWCDYLQQLHVRSIDLALGRVNAVASRLSLSQPLCPVITVAGSNGKGSVVNFLEALYLKAGYRVGAYTSPYLLSFNEQFRFNGQWIEDEKLCVYFDKINQARAEIILTYFEFKTLAAFLYFAEMKPDLLVLEVGIGGRLDAVNLMDPTIAVITSLSLDHCDWLGHTREQIAYEKAGIFRSDKPAVCGDLNPPATIQEVAEKIGARVFYRHRDFFITERENGAWDWQSASLVLKNLPASRLLKDNIATALKVVDLLSSMFSDLQVDENTIRLVIATTSVPGRQQVISKDPFVVVDVAHNEDSVRRLAQFLRKQQKKKVAAVFSLLKTKDLRAIANIMMPYVEAWYIAEIEDKRAMPLAEMEEILKNHGACNVSRYASIVEAYCAAQQNEASSIVVFGSFHVVGPVLKYCQVT